MPENELIFKNLLNASEHYDLMAEDEIEMKINGTIILKEQVPNDKKWFTHISIYIEEKNI